MQWPLLCVRRITPLFFLPFLYATIIPSITTRHISRRSNARSVCADLDIATRDAFRSTDRRYASIRRCILYDRLCAFSKYINRMPMYNHLPKRCRMMALTRGGTFPISDLHHDWRYFVGRSKIDDRHHTRPIMTLCRWHDDILGIVHMERRHIRFVFSRTDNSGDIRKHKPYADNACPIYVYNVAIFRPY